MRPASVSAAASSAPESTGGSPLARALLGRQRGWRAWFSSDRLARWFCQGNAAIALVVLALITWTVFADAVGFIPQNRSNLAVYRLAGLEFVDLLRDEVRDHEALGRYLTALRLEQAATWAGQGLDRPAVQARLAEFDAFAGRFDGLIEPQRELLAEMTDTASALKERHGVAEDLREAKRNYLAGMIGAPPERAAALKAAADGLEIETIDFVAEIQPLLARRPGLLAANRRLIADLAAQHGTVPTSEVPEMRRKLQRVEDLVDQLAQGIRRTDRLLAAWKPTKPVGAFEAFTAFAFGRKWVTASFWQDWYGVLPLLAGSLLVSALALLAAIPLGVAAAVYVNQAARPFEQRLIKPAIEFIAAIPSVVLGFFGIAVFGETLRRVSQVAWLDWVPGFPMLERLNAATAAGLLALMAVPTIFSLAEDALNNVPRAYQEASLALGATRWQTILRIIMPAALSGIMAAILLGFGRVVGETMVVLLCAGNRIEIPDLTAGLGVVFQPVHTMTGIIAQEMGEVVRQSIHYRALFMVGALLFLLSLLINWLAQRFVRRHRLAAG